MKRLVPKQGSAAVDKELIRELADLLQETGLAEIEIEHEGFRIRVARPTVAASGSVMATPATAPPQQPLVEPVAVSDRAAHPGLIKSPMVGTAYLAPAPGAQAFVEVGGEIKKGQTILIIEAMKTMNPIPSPRDGRVIDIMVSDGQPVEFGEPLMIID